MSGVFAGPVRAALTRAVRSHRRDAVWLAAWSLAEALPALAFGWVVAQAASRFLADEPALGLGWLGVLALAAVAGSLAARPAYRRLAALVEPLRDDLIRLVVTGTLRGCGTVTAPADTGAVARITQQAEIVRDTFAGLLSAARTFAFTTGSALVGLLTLVPAVLPFVIPPLVASLIVLQLLLRPLARRQRRAVLAEESVARAAAQATAGLRDAVACGAEDQVHAGVTAEVRAQADAAVSLARVSAARSLCLATGGWLPLLLVLAAAPWLRRHGVTAPQLLGAVAYIGASLRGALSTLTQGLAGSGVRLAIALGRIIEASGDWTASAGPALAGTAVPRTASPGTIGPASASPASAGPGYARYLISPSSADRLAVHAVSFRYGPHAVPVLHDLSLDIPDGDHLAIVGPSGIGKSTLAGLLAGLLRPTAGQITLGGVPLTGIPPAELTGRRVLIPQEAYVFAGTLAENLAYHAPAATPAELAAASSAVGMDSLVGRLGGFAGCLNPAALSAGERQLVALARAYLSPARIVILDEAACYLDPAAEARAEQAFAARDGTVIVIAHRVSSALRARRILVLDGSRAQAGDHVTLLATSPLYRDLVGYWQAGPTRANGPKLSSHQ